MFSTERLHLYLYGIFSVISFALSIVSFSMGSALFATIFGGLTITLSVVAYTEYLHFRKKKTTKNFKITKDIDIIKVIESEGFIASFQGSYLSSFEERPYHHPYWMEEVEGELEQVMSHIIQKDISTSKQYSHNWDIYSEIQDMIKVGKIAAPFEIIFLTENRSKLLDIKKLGYLDVLAVIHHENNSIIEAYDSYQTEYSNRIDRQIDTECSQISVTYKNLVSRNNWIEEGGNIITLNRQVPDEKITKFIDTGIFHPTRWVTVSKPTQVADYISVRDEGVNSPLNDIIACDIGLIPYVLRDIDDRHNFKVSIISYTHPIDVGIPCTLRDPEWKSIFFEAIDGVLSRDAKDIKSSIRETMYRFDDLLLEWTAEEYISVDRGSSKKDGAYNIGNKNEPQKSI